MKRSGQWRMIASAVAIALALSERAAAQEEGEQPAPPHNPWSLTLSAELGMGSRDVGLPAEGTVYRIESGPFAAAGLGFALDHALSSRFSLGLHARYQSSLGHGVAELHTDGSQHPLDLRSHRLELALAPAVRLDAAGTFTLLASSGYGFHNLRPEVHHLLTPAYSLSGPYLRAGLQLAVLGGALRFVLAPEAQWIAHVSQDLADRGIGASGLGAGGEGAVELALGQRWAIRAAYREMRFWIDTRQLRRFEDTARFVTARLSGRL